MRFITFKTLEAKNFLSFGDNNSIISLRPGVNAITGINLDKEDSANGCGKSAITEILYYSLYGNTIREIGKDFITNSLTNGVSEVSLTFSINSNNSTEEYKIVRRLNPTKCFLFKNGEDITRSTLAKTNSLIQDLLRTPPTVFQNSVIMSANNALPFMALPKTDRRKFIESVLGLEVFTAMVLKVREEHSNLKREYELSYSKLEQLQTELKFNQSQIDNYETLKLERLNKLNEKQNSLLRDINLLEEKIKNFELISTDTLDEKLNVLKGNINESQNKLSLLQEKLHKVSAEISLEKKQVNKLLADRDSCPTCKRNYSEEHVEHVQKSIKKHQDNISAYEEAEIKINSAISEVKKIIKKLIEEQEIVTEHKKDAAKKAVELNTFSVSKQHLISNKKSIEEEIKQVEIEQNNQLKEKIYSLTNSVTELNEKVNSLNNSLNVIETVKYVFSEEGIKSFIVKKILKVLNSRVAYYLKKLQANCLCKFNEFFDEDIVDENGKGKSYFNFSGGERKRIDLACLFAFSDVRRLQGDVNFSTVFYDELLDSSLDDKGVLLTLKILRERFQENGESCYIITHRGNHVITKAEHNIHVTKQNGISTVEC